MTYYNQPSNPGYAPNPAYTPQPNPYPAAPAAPTWPQPMAQPGAPQQGFQPVPQQQRPDASSIFAGISEAQVSKSSNWIRPGQYILQIGAMKLIKNLQQERLLIIELRCLKVISTAFADQLGIPAHVPGEELAISYNSKHLPFLGNVKGMVAALEGVPPERIDEDLRREGTTLLAHCDRMTSEEQPYANMIVEVTARQVTTRKGGQYTRVNWGREIRPTELATMLPPAEIARFFPGDTFARMIEAEGRIHGGNGQQAQMPQQAPLPNPGVPAGHQYYGTIPAPSTSYGAPASGYGVQSPSSPWPPAPSGFSPRP